MNLFVGPYSTTVLAMGISCPFNWITRFGLKYLPDAPVVQSAIVMGPSTSFTSLILVPTLVIFILTCFKLNVWPFLLYFIYLGPLSNFPCKSLDALISASFPHLFLLSYTLPNPSRLLCLVWYSLMLGSLWALMITMRFGHVNSDGNLYVGWFWAFS